VAVVCPPLRSLRCARQLEASVALAWVPETGELVSIDTDSNEQTAVAPSFGAFFESFRDSLVANKWEFADGWVSTE